MKKRLIIGSLILITFLVLGNKIFVKSIVSNESDFDNGYENHIFDDKYMIFDGKMSEYSDLNDVEKESNLIVIAKKEHENDATIERFEGTPVVIYTLSDIKITKVIKGNIDVNETVAVLENSGYDPVTDKMYYIGNYEPMELDKEYLLFLRKSETGDNYVPSGVGYGVVPLSNEKSAFRKAIAEANTEYAKSLLQNKQHVDEIHEKARNKYKEYLQ